MAPKLLDLFCCQGGAGVGYARAGWEVHGIDVTPQPNYPLAFTQADAIEYVRAHGREYQAIHASPPCQAHSTMTNARAKAQHTDLIPDTRAALDEIGLPYVIENVAGARQSLKSPVMLCGSMFGLKVQRHRLFEVSGFSFTEPCPCNHSKRAVGVYGNRQRKHYTRPDGTNRGYKAATPEEASEALGGVEWMNWRGMTQCIPPIYAEHIGHAMLEALG